MASKLATWMTTRSCLTRPLPLYPSSGGSAHALRLKSSAEVDRGRGHHGVPSLELAQRKNVDLAESPGLLPAVLAQKSC